MHALIASVLNVILSGAMTCQAPQENREGDLVPVESSLTYHSPEYHLKLREILMRKAPAKCPLQFLVVPSFEPETLLSLHEVEGGFEAQVVKPDQQIWPLRATQQAIVCTERNAVVPVPIAVRLTGLWRSMLLRTHYSTSEPQILDGVSYLFFSWKQRVGDWSGEANSPGKGTRAFAMAEVGECLVSYVEAEPAKRPDLQALLEKAMDRLDALLAESAKGTDKAKSGEGDGNRRGDPPAPPNPPQPQSAPGGKRN